MTGRFSNFNSISYTEDRHALRVTGTKCRLPDTMSGTGVILISGAAGSPLNELLANSLLENKEAVRIFSSKNEKIGKENKVSENF